MPGRGVSPGPEKRVRPGGERNRRQRSAMGFECWGFPKARGKGGPGVFRADRHARLCRRAPSARFGNVRFRGVSCRGLRGMGGASVVASGSGRTPAPCRGFCGTWSCVAGGVLSRTAVYGPVRTVVWQGSAGDRRPYADHRGLGVREIVVGTRQSGSVQRTGRCLEACRSKWKIWLPARRPSQYRW